MLRLAYRQRSPYQFFMLRMEVYETFLACASCCQSASLTAAVAVLLLPHDFCLQLSTILAIMVYVLSSMVEWVVASTLLPTMPVSILTT
mgnify:CR=1 FL=1